MILRTLRKLLMICFKNVRSRFKPSGLKLFKCSFVIENIQQFVFENLTPILNTRYWTTDVYKQHILMILSFMV